MKWFLLFSICTLFCLSPSLLSAQSSLVVKVQGLKQASGVVRVVLYNKAKNFLKFEGLAANGFAKASAGETEVIFQNLPHGDYAIALYHDKNDNKVMDKNWWGIPVEPLGFSNAKLGSFGPPKFEDCVFSFKANTEISILLENNK